MGDINVAFVLLICVALAGCIWALIRLLHKTDSATAPPPPPTPNTPSPPPNAPVPSGVSFEDPWKFYSIQSVDGNNGVDINGDLRTDNKISTDARWQSMDSFLTRSDFLFRAPFSGDSWDDILREQLKKGAAVLRNVSQPAKCLLVEAPAVVILTGDCSLEGLVVRRGGTVLLAPGLLQEAHGLGRTPRALSGGGSMKLSLQFGLCESGGLVQCGFAEREGREARLPADRSLLIQFVDAPQGFRSAGAACSQYSYRVHTPGVTEIPSDQSELSPQCESDLSASMLGGCVTNVVGAKAFGCLFNGNLHLAGSVPPPFSYALWKASSGSKISSESFGSGIQQLDELTTPRSSYAACWTSCREAVLKGATTLQTTDDVHNWPVGAQVVVTCHSAAWVPEGSYMDHRQCKYGNRQGDGYACPEPVIDFYVAGEGPPLESQGFGVEVAVIASASGKTLTLQSALHFDHSRGGVSSFQASDGSSQVQVETPVHVGLLTRNIRICGRDSSSQVKQVPPPFEAKVSSQLYDSSQDLSFEERESRMRLMAMGRMNRSLPPGGPNAATRGVPEPSQWKGQGGSVTCDFSASRHWDYLYYADETQPPGPLGVYLHDSSLRRDCGSQGPVARGSALLGDDGKEGLGYILGATLKFQYGCGVVLDGVELYRMGIPANTGSLGQYSLHFHCAGWGPAFESYAVSGARRHLRVANSVNWRSYSRWCVLHGTNFADVSNNVFCVCMGNGVFTEDGVEHHNNIEHNLMVLNVQTGQTKLASSHGLDQNPGGVVGNFGPDGASSASIWLTNTNNYVYRNVLCCNPAYGAGIWAVAINPRSKAAPATHCVGSEALGLPGLVGDSLASWDPKASRGIFLRGFFGGLSSPYFSSFQGTHEAIGNVKNLGLDGGARPAPHLGTLQSCPYLAENTVYSMCQFYVESTGDNSPWVDNMRSFFVAERQFIPINGNTTGSFLLNNAAGGYPEAAGTSKELGGIYVPRVFSQNLCFSMQGFCMNPAFGGFVWTQSGNSVLVGNCVLGGDYWSTPSSLKNSASGNNMGNYATVLIDMVTNAAISGSRNANSCEGTLVSGPKTMLGLQTCTGSRFKVPPNQRAPFGNGVVCEAANDDPSASWVAFADGIQEGDVAGLLKIWLGGGYAEQPSSGNRMPLRGVRQDMTCFPSAGQPPPPDSLNYVFLFDASTPSNCRTYSTTAAQNQMVSKPWSPQSKPGVPCASCDGDRVDEKYKEIYPVLNIAYVSERWGAVCSAANVLPQQPGA